MQPPEYDAKLKGRAVVDVKVQGKAQDVTKLAYAGTAKLTNVDAEYKDLPAPLSNVTGTMQFSQAALTIQSLKGKFGSNPFTIKGKVVNYQTNPAVNLALTATIGLAEAGKLAKLDDKADLGGKAIINAKAAGPVKNLAKLNLGGKVILNNIAYLAKDSDLPKLHELSGVVALDKQNVSMTGVSGKLGKSDFKVNGKLMGIHSFYSEKHRNEKLKFDVAMASTKLDLDELRPKQESDEKSDSVTIASLLKRVEGKTTVNAKVVHFNKIKAKNVKGTATIKNSVFNLKGFNLNAFGGNVGLVGKASFADAKKPNFDLNLDLNKIQAGELLNYSKGLNKFGQLAGFFAGELTTKAAFKGDLNQQMELNMNSPQLERNAEHG